MGYNWIIEKDYIGTKAKGRNNFSISQIDNKENESDFRMYDDDGILYYAGKIWGDFEGFEPLDDFGEGYAGCTEIKYKVKNQWETL